MINKYSGITIIVLVIVSILGSWMLYKKQTKNFYVSNHNTIESQQMIRQIKIKPEAFESLKVMNDVIDKLSQSRVATNTNISIAMSSFENKEKRPLVEVPSAKEKQRLLARRICRQARRLNVSMSFVSSDDKYAVIADKFVREGQLINGKFKVVGINIDKVKVQKQGISCNIKVRNSSNIVQN
jgi:hypothetical protein